MNISDEASNQSGQRDDSVHTLTEESVQLARAIVEASGAYPHEPINQMEALRIAEALIRAGYRQPNK